MPSVDLSPLEAQIVFLAAQKKKAQQAAAEQAFQLAEQQFSADVALVTKAHNLPGDAKVSFHVENGAGTVTWPDITPAESAA